MLAENPTAKTLHATGLAHELAGRYPEAHQDFEQALAPLSTPPLYLDEVVQRARIVRDNGFTYAREALANNDPAFLGLASQELFVSVDMTAPFASGQRYLGTQGVHGHETPKLARRELLAEHGATLGVLGRLATVQQVLLGIDTRGNSPDAVKAREIAQQPYGLAHDLLRIGNNGYYRVNNAMNGARQEILNGRVLHAGKWVVRATYGVGWTLFRNTSRVGDALRTYGRILDLRSYDAARSSVFKRP